MTIFLLVEVLYILIWGCFETLWSDFFKCSFYISVRVFTVVQYHTYPCISVLCSLSDLADPGVQVLQTVCCHIQGLNWVRREVLGVDREYVRSRVFPIFMNHWTETETTIKLLIESECWDSDASSLIIELTNMAGGYINESFEECTQRTVLCGLGHDKRNRNEGGSYRKRRCTLLNVGRRTHCFIQLSCGRTGHLLHIVCREPQLLLPTVVASPPKDDTGQCQAFVCGENEQDMNMHAEIRSPATLLFVYVEDERLFGETELVFSLSSIVIQSFDCTLKRKEARRNLSLLQRKPNMS